MDSQLVMFKELEDEPLGFIGYETVGMAIFNKDVLARVSFKDLRSRNYKVLPRLMSLLLEKGVTVVPDGERVVAEQLVMFKHWQQDFDGCFWGTNER